MERLQLCDNNLIDFIGSDAIDSLEDINLDHNPLISFRGFPVLKNLKSLSLLGSPISHLPNFRALAILVASSDLLFLNGNQVTTSDCSSASAYDFGGCTRPLVVSGWIPRRPVAPAHVLRTRPAEKDKRPHYEKAIVELVERQESEPDHANSAHNWV
jgi:hypothetical protein